MALNPFSTFQKNRRFWMALILMVCMISFVFCTGLRGDMGERLLAWFGRGGDAVARVGGRNVTRKELYDLKQQREVADRLMRYCVNDAFENLSKRLFEEEKKHVNDKEIAKRQQELTQLYAMRESLAHRKTRTNYFDTGRKFDELLEFMLWQAQADQLGIKLEPEQVDFLYQMEFYRALSEQQLYMAEHRTRQEFQGVSHTLMVKAIAEEFRVKIAQYAVMGEQPSSFFYRGKKGDDFVPKMTIPEVPDEIRAPMTLAQLWDVYRKMRSEFDVTLVPIHVKDFLKTVPTPTPEEQGDFFKTHNKPYDPASPTPGVEMPSEIKVEFVTADPTSPAYLNLAKAKGMLEVLSPFAVSPMQSPLAIAAHYAGAAELDLKIYLQRHYEALSRSKGDKYATASMSVGAGTSAMAAYFSHRYPQAAAGLVASSFLSPIDGVGALTGYMAYGALEHPLQKGDPKAEPKYRTEIIAGARAEAIRRAPFYATVLPVSAVNQPLETINWLQLMYSIPGGDLPIEVVHSDIRDMIARRQAETWARASMQVVKRALDDATGNDAAEKFKRVLNKLVPELKLTYGPADKDAFYHRFNIDDAKELKPIHDAYVKSIDMINYFEGRDLNPDTILKPTDYQKIFFDSSELFSATSLYRAMPWPPAVTPNKARAWKNPNTRLIDTKNITPELGQNFRQLLMQNEPGKAMPSFDLFVNAERPILFWRTAEATPARPADYAKIKPELDAREAEIKKLKTKQTLTAGDKKNLAELMREASELRDIEAKVIEGFKFERARMEAAMPRAKEIAEKLVKSDNDPNVLLLEAKTLPHELIALHKLSRMHPERLPNFDQDYFDYSLPKDVIAYPRVDMARQLVRLDDLKEPIEIKDRDADKAAKDAFAIDLDKINKELFNKVKERKNPEGKYVQIFTNKPRSIFYVAVVTNRNPAVITARDPGDFERTPFTKALQGAPMELRFGRDQFVTRAQQQEAKEFRADVVKMNLRERLGYEIIAEKAREDFDRVGGD